MPRSTLSSGLPPLPNPDQGGPNVEGSAQQALTPPPAPTHGQTVAALRHFDAILGQLSSLLKNPDLGKADVRSQIIDGMTQLVSERIIPPAQAVAQLASVPDKPFDQRKWAEQQFMQTVQAQSAVLDHHRTQAVGTGNYDLENMLHESEPDDHLDTIKGMMQAHYAGQPNA